MPAINCSQMTIQNVKLIMKDSSAQQKIGDMAQLDTQAKSSLVGAINEVRSTAVQMSYDENTETLTISAQGGSNA